MIKNGLRHPKKVLVYLALGSMQYRTWKYASIVNADFNGFNVQPQNTLEEHMIKPTDICQHLATLHMLTCELNLKAIVELGTRDGESTIALLQAAKKIGGHVYSVDINPCLEAKKVVKECGLTEYWEFIQGDDLNIQWEKPIDHLFIDTSHTFEHTLEELKKFEPYVRKGGIIIMHDIVAYPEMMRAINNYIGNRTDLCIYKYFNNNGLAVIFKS
jgi:predicted O-methyltransferase YrrM